MTQAVYLLGGPGVGKSTIMARLLQGWNAGPYVRLTSRELFGHMLLSDDLQVGVYLGHLRPEYPGTDALSLSVAPQAMLWLQKRLNSSVDWVFGEGTRLGHPGFLTELAARTDLTVVHLTVAPEIAELRRILRGGKMLSERYCLQAASKAESAARACEEAGLRVLRVDTSGPLEESFGKVLAGTGIVG